MRKLVFVMVAFLVMLVPTQTLANYSQFFVVFEDHVYELSSEAVTEVGEKIGEVTEYGDRAEFYSGNFSNAYEVGTAYYEIPGVDTSEQIAVEESPGVFIVGKRSVEFTSQAVQESSLSTQNIGSIFSFVVIGIIGFFVFKRLTPKRVKKEEEE